MNKIIIVAVSMLFGCGEPVYAGFTVRGVDEQLYGDDWNGF